jgi:hypothetical protein
MAGANIVEFYTFEEIISKNIKNGKKKIHS